MKINKKEIIDEIISLEPELDNDRKKLENILEDIINIKPNVNISSVFKEELKDELLLKIKGNSEVYKNYKYNYLKFFTSFIFWWITAFSLIWIFWINLNLLNIDKNWNIEELSVQQVNIDSEPEVIETMPMWARMWLMKMSTESILEEDMLMEEANIMMEEVLVDNNDLFTELKMYLENLGLDNKIIEKILNIVKKYK